LGCLSSRFADLSQIQNRSGDRKAAVGMAFGPDQNDRRAEVKRLFRHLQRVRAAKEPVEHAQTVDLCRQAAETLEPGQETKSTPWTFNKAPSGTLRGAAKQREAHERHHDLAQAQKRQQGQSLEHGRGM
jgi:hypothetical protein